MRLCFLQLGIGIAHLFDERLDKLVEEQRVVAKLLAVAYGAPNDAAKHVTPPLSTRQHAIDDQERAGTNVIGDDMQRTLALVFHAEYVSGRIDQVREQVDLVIAVNLLHDGRDALKAHTCIDRRFRQRLHLAVGRPVELHEDEVPDLDVAIAILFRRSRRTALDVRAMVEENLATRTTGTCITHRPEVVLLAHAREAFRIDTDFLQPDIGCFVIFPKDRDPQAFRRQLERLGQKLPRELDGFALEVIAKAEIAEHLEERVMPRGVANVLEVVVLTARTHATLRRRCAHIAALVLAEKAVLELHHAGIGEQQCRIVARHQGRARDNLVIVVAEKVQERLAQLVAGHGLHRAYGNG